MDKNVLNIHFDAVISTLYPRVFPEFFHAITHDSDTHAVWLLDSYPNTASPDSMPDHTESKLPATLTSRHCPESHQMALDAAIKRESRDTSTDYSLRSHGRNSR